MSDETRKGLNEAEAVMLRLAQTFGDDPSIWDALEPHAASHLRELQRPIDEQVLAQWQREDQQRVQLHNLSANTSQPRQAAHLSTLSSRWQAVASRALESEGEVDVHRQHYAHIALSALTHGPHQLSAQFVAQRGAFDLGFLCLANPRQVPVMLERIGAFQLAEVLRPLERRQIVRLLREMPAELRAWIKSDFLREREVDPLEQARIRDVFVAFQKTIPDWSVRARHVGLFFVATSAGERFPTRVRRLMQRLPDGEARALYQYHQQARWSSRRGLDNIIRQSLGALWEELHALNRHPSHLTTP